MQRNKTFKPGHKGKELDARAFDESDWAKFAKADQKQHKLKLQMHFKSLELEEMKKRPFKSAHTQLIEEHEKILEERKKKISFAPIDYGLDICAMTVTRAFTFWHTSLAVSQMNYVFHVKALWSKVEFKKDEGMCYCSNF